MNKPPTQYHCPLRVAVVGYYLFTISALTLVWAVVLRFFPIRGHHQLGLPATIAELVYALLAAMCAFYIFKGANWSRILFFILAAINIVRRVQVGGHFWLIFTGGILGLLVVLLLTPCAHRYFTGRDPFLRRPKDSTLPGTRPREGRYEY